MSSCTYILYAKKIYNIFFLCIVADLDSLGSASLCQIGSKAFPVKKDPDLQHCS